MSPQTIDDETLFAYLDGELDAAQRAQVAAAIADDPRLAATLGEQQRLKGQLHAHFDAVLDEPVGAHLTQVVAASGPASVTDMIVAREKRGGRAPRGVRHWTVREWSAIAATLVLGLLVGLNLNRGTGDAPLVASDAGLTAAGLLASALSDRPAGALPGAAGSQIGFSFQAKGGGYCRTFALNSGETGLACRRDDHWVVDALAAGSKPAAAGAFRLAGSDMPAALRTAIEQKMAGDPLTEAEERAQIARQWRRTGQPANQSQ